MARRGGTRHNSDDGGSAHPRDDVSAYHEQRELTVLYGMTRIHRARGVGTGAVGSAHDG